MNDVAPLRDDPDLLLRRALKISDRAEIVDDGRTGWEPLRRRKYELPPG